MSRGSGQPRDDSARLTLGQAARLADVPKAYLRELTESGRLAVHLVSQDGAVKFRVTPASLAEAGLIAAPDEPASAERAGAASPGEPRDLSELVALIREQSDRITSLEEQRFQLGAQLGAALERIASLEVRIAALPPAPVLQEVAATVEAAAEIALAEQITVDASDEPRGVRLRDRAWRLTDAGLQQSARLRAGILGLRARSRRSARTTSNSPAD